MMGKTSSFRLKLAQIGNEYWSSDLVIAFTALLGFWFDFITDWRRTAMSIVLQKIF